MAEDWQLYVAQKAFIAKGDEVLILIDELGLDFPGGKLQVGETDFQAALRREVTEETTLEIEIGEPFAIWSRKLPPLHKYAGKTVFLVGYKCKYKSGEVTLSDEHSEYHWVNKENFRKFDDGSDYFKILEKYLSAIPSSSL